MLLHICEYQESLIYTLFDSQDRVVKKPTFYFRHLRKRGRHPTSQRQIANVIKLFCEWIEESSTYRDIDVDLILTSIDFQDIIDWINYQRADGKAPTTIHNREALVREFFRWLTTADGGRERQDIPWDGEKTITKNPHHRLPRFVTMEQVILLLSGLHNESQRVASHALYDTGMRVSELCRLTNEFLPNEKDWPPDINYYPLLVPGSKAQDGSLYKKRFTIISKPMLSRIRRYQSTPEYLLARTWSLFDPNKPVFLNVHGDKLSIDSVQKGIASSWKRQSRGSGEISPHRLRHGTAVAILLSELGKELQDNFLILKSILGHADISTTEIYASIPIAALKSLSGRNQIRLKFEEAQQIYDATYLPARLHREKRGHRK